jgi:hypothetical protein
MRIISAEHDYYDCVQRVDHDRSVIYQRHPVRTEWERKDWAFPESPFPEILHLGNNSMQVTMRIVGFCGKIYPLIEMSLDSMTQPAACWSLADVDAYLKSVLIDDAWKEYCDDNKKYKRRRWYDLSGRRKRCREFFDECKKKESSFTGLFEKHKCPIFVATWKFFESVFEANALLAPLGFYRVFDTNRAWMEISQYVSNQALPIRPIPKLDDKTLAEAKGFDKYSFRKDKSKR